MKSVFTKFAVLSQSEVAVKLFVYPTAKIEKIAAEKYNGNFKDACTEIVADNFNLDEVSFVVSNEDIPTEAINVEF